MRSDDLSQTGRRPTRTEGRVLVVHCGEGDPPVAGAVVVRVTPDEPTRAAAEKAVAASGLSSADTRTKVVFSTSAGPELSAVAWAATVGFFDRLVDIVIGDKAIGFGLASPLPGVEMAAVGSLARCVSEVEDPDVQADLCVQLGAPHAEVPEVEPTPAGLARLRLARRARVVTVPADTYATMGRVALAAAVRRRGNKERLPGLVVGDEPFDPKAKGEAGIDLDSVRRGAHSIRKAARVDNRDALCEPVALTGRQQRLAAAAQVDVEAVLHMLGSQRSVIIRAGVTAVWTCPVATHGVDLEQATVQVVRGVAQCVRCGRDKHDALRLVMWAKGCTADEAADDLEASFGPLTLPLSANSVGDG
jgi:hypothetical protein